MAPCSPGVGCLVGIHGWAGLLRKPLSSNPAWMLATQEFKLTSEHPGSSLVAQTVKASAYNVGDPGLIPGLGRSPGEGNGTRLQYSCLENPMDGGAWWATVHEVAKSQTRLSNFTHSFTHSEHSTICIIPIRGEWQRARKDILDKLSTI